MLISILKHSPRYLITPGSPWDREPGQRDKSAVCHAITGSKQCNMAKRGEMQRSKETRLLMKQCSNNLSPREKCILHSFNRSENLGPLFLHSRSHRTWWIDELIFEKFERIKSIWILMCLFLIERYISFKERMFLKKLFGIKRHFNFFKCNYIFEI